MDIEQTMKFILEMQAKHELAIQKSDERMAKSDERMAKSDERMVKTDERIAGLVDVCFSLARHGEETDRRIRELRDAQAQGEYKLNALIDTVDKLVRRNGGAPGAA